MSNSCLFTREINCGLLVFSLFVGYSAIWVGAFVSGSASLMRCCYYYSMTVSSIRPDSAIETAHALRGQTTSIPLDDVIGILDLANDFFS